MAERWLGRVAPSKERRQGDITNIGDKKKSQLWKLVRSRS
jgi:hypothetical protein